jgi:hypothetical protein
MINKHWYITSHAGCEICPAVETISHILLRCKEEQQVWRHLSLDDLATNSANILSFVTTAEEITVRLWNIAFPGCAVTLWSMRNARIFEEQTFHWNWTRMQIYETLQIWSTGTKKSKSERVS